MQTVSLHLSERPNPLGRAGLSLLLCLLVSGPALAQALRWEPLERPMRPVAVLSLAAPPDGALYVGAAGEGALYRRAPGAETRTRIPFPQPSIDAVMPVSPDTLFVNAADTGGGEYRGALYRSLDGGATWERMDPFNPHVTTIVRTSGDALLALDFLDRFLRSDDGGQTWREASPELPFEVPTDLLRLPYGRLLTGAIHGVWISDDGATWTPTGLTDPIVTTAAVAPGGVWYAGTSREGLWRSTDEGATWTRIAFAGRSIHALAITPEDAVVAAVDARGVFRLRPGAETWTTLGLEDASVTMLAAGDAGRVLAASATALYRSTDDGEHWRRTAWPETRPLRALFATPAGEVFAATEDDGLRRSTDFGRTWQETPFPDAAEAAALTGTPRGDVFAGTNHGVFRSGDGGMTWQPAGLDTLAVHALTLDDEGRLLILGEGPEFFRTAEPVSTPGAPSAEGVALEQNYPNPASGAITVTFVLPERTAVSLDVYDVLGRRVARLAAGTYAPGLHRLTWDPSKLAAGLYVYRLEALGRVETRRMVLLPAR
ncbi:T9SS type A sorting domain-containing protein [Rhodocaloribacter sp.]